MRVGDLLGSGTISGPTEGAAGSLVELSRGINLEGGEKRRFLEDHDIVVIRGWAGEDGERVGFGECVGTILPAIIRG